MPKILSFGLVGCAALSTLVGCGGGGGSGSGVPKDSIVSTLTINPKEAICEDQNAYLIAAIGSAQNWCRWQGQNSATGTTDAELQSTCAVQEDACLANAQANFDAAKATINCVQAEPLSATQVYRYADCNTTVGQLEECGYEQIDILASLRNIPCTEYSVARRVAINTDLGAASCDEIDPTCPPPP